MRKKSKHKPRLAIISRAEKSAWLSCQSIARNLASAYSCLGDRVRFFEISTNKLIETSAVAAIEIHRYDPDVIVFIEHQPHPIVTLHAIRTIYGTKKPPEIVFHIYGDFTIFSREWVGLGKLLNDIECQFICASERQKNLISRLILDHASIDTFPFLVNTKTFFPSSLRRTQWRSKLNIRSTEKLIVYTGRLSMQKNVNMLISIFGEIAIRHPGIKLAIAGRTDDLGAPLFGWQSRFGNDEELIAQEVNRLKKAIRERILRLGLLDSSSLNGLYNAADCFSSLSLHHDEDFGMSAAEALCCGVQVYLTDWGGFSDFVKLPENGQSIPVSLGIRGLSINKSRCVRELLNAVARSETFDQRRARAELNKKFYSVQHTHGQLLKIIEKRRNLFKGFSPTMGQLAFRTQMDSALYGGGPKKGNFYAAIYSAYLSRE